MHRLRRGDRGVDVAHRRAGDHPALDDGGGLDAEERRRPDNQICQLARLNRAHFMGDTVGQRRVNGVFGDVALHAEVVVLAGLFRQRAALDLHAVRDLRCG